MDPNRKHIIEELYKDVVIMAGYQEDPNNVLILFRNTEDVNGERQVQRVRQSLKTYYDWDIPDDEVQRTGGFVGVWIPKGAPDNIPEYRYLDSKSRLKGYPFRIDNVQTLDELKAKFVEVRKRVFAAERQLN